MAPANHDNGFNTPPWRRFIDNVDGEYVSIIGIGSLLSERSSRMTFPNLINFRMAKMTGYRRIFCHPAPIFYKRGIAKPDTKELSSLSAERLMNTDYDVDPKLKNEIVIVTTFQIPKDEIPAFVEREEEFDFSIVDVQDIENYINGKDASCSGLLCTRSTDAEFIKKHGIERFDEDCRAMGLSSIWDSPGEIYPCRLYLRHCLLAAKKLSTEAYENFLDTTYLYDRKTKLRSYVEEKYDLIMNELPPAGLGDRYDG